MPTIIDGYNLIFTCGIEGKTRSPQSLEKARARLVATVASKLSKKERSGTTIVFDAKRLPIKETSADFRAHDIRVLYAVDHEDADTLIEELIAKHSTPKKLVVVSSDHRLQTAATRRKATGIDSDVWYDRLLSSGIKQPQPGSSSCDAKQQSIQSLESINWIQEFGEIEIPPVKLDDKPSTESHSEPPNPETDQFNPFPPGYGEDLLED